MAGRKKGRGPAQGPTAADVAALANVSRATVSRTFRAGAVDAETKARILEAARKVGYRINHGARPTLTAQDDEARSRRATVGLVMGGLDNPFYNEVLTLFLNALHARGLRVLCRTAVSLDSSEQEVRTMLRYGVDALVIASSGIRSTAIDASRDAGVPVVLFNRNVPGAQAPSVQTDNYAGGRLIADLLLRAGHERLAFVNGFEGSSTNADRKAGFAARVRELGAALPVEEYGDYTYGGGREAARRLMLSPRPPDAIFCANDISALGVMDGLRADLKLSVPGDVSVIGFDDIAMAAWPSFDLTTVRQRRNLMVREAMEILDAVLTDPAASPRERSIEGRLIVRGSSRLPLASEPRVVMETI